MRPLKKSLGIARAPLYASTSPENAERCFREILPARPSAGVRQLFVAANACLDLRSTVRLVFGIKQSRCDHLGPFLCPALPNWPGATPAALQACRSEQLHSCPPTYVQRGGQQPLESYAILDDVLNRQGRSRTWHLRKRSRAIIPDSNFHRTIRPCL